jgi:hypothetical protein
VASHPHKPKHITVNRHALSPHAGAAILQLLPELWRNAENKKQALERLRHLKQTIQIVINTVAHDRWREPKKPQKRNAKSAAQRAEWFAKRLAGTETYKADKIEPEQTKTLQQYEEDNRAQPLPVTPVRPMQPVKTPAQLAYEANLRTSREIAAERGEDWD